jgi:hypothetical protein
MSKEPWQAPTVASLRADKTYLNELTPISPDCATHSCERSSGPPQAVPPVPGNRPPTITVERTSKASDTFVDTSEQTIIQWNIKRFHNLLLTESDADRRTLVARLLSEEQVKLLNLLTPILSEHHPSGTYLKAAATQAKVCE